MYNFKGLKTWKDKIKIKTFFVWLSVFFLISQGYVTYKYVAFINDNIVFAKGEKDGLKPYPSLRHLVKTTFAAELAVLVHAEHNDNVDIEHYLNQIEKDLNEVNEALASLGRPELMNRIQSLRDAWALQKVSLNTQSAENKLTQLNLILEGVTGMMGDVANYTNLSLDPEATTYGLMSIFSASTPSLIRHLSSMSISGMALLKSNEAALREKIVAEKALFDSSFAQTQYFSKIITGLDRNEQLTFSSIKKEFSINPFSELFEKILQSPGAATADTLIRTVTENFNDYYQINGKSLALFTTKIDQRLAGYHVDMLTSLAMVVALFVMSACLLLMMYRSISKIIKLMVNAANAITEGDLSVSIEEDIKNEFSPLINAINLMCKKLIEVLSNIQASAHTVARGSEEISQGNLDLSQRTEQQATSLASTAASMEQISVTIKDNAEQSQRAAIFADEARNHAAGGGAVVEEAIQAMNNINENSKKIAEIISVIDSIAFQTNLLALNAAVEAARAGDQGKGFAVVAAEVRNLSQRCSTAAKEINALINTSVKSIDAGTLQVHKSGESLKAIVESTTKVNDLVKAIAGATKEQSIGLEEINKSVVQIDGITQQNAALVEQTAAASENVNHQSHSLLQMVKFFTLHEDDKDTIKLTENTPKTHSKPAKPKKAPMVKPSEQQDDADWTEF